ncbi:hypothetical protein A2415_01020 [candidate division WWE3 bacterium RIFOXYC1_FULL_39_7]|uniref:G5 domain-containing protein n=1 Tax=candidate division WWE3 bacterium RIFOXYC1_FULL_39_7 TaxID=1802643 RepID=A0A1F4WLI8_UNCKA|nr:MAG: hypothetical protein A2415_01020 [candidate division WWE3 bacterium RIFOXYC1_FULL_39_7]
MFKQTKQKLHKLKKSLKEFNPISIAQFKVLVVGIYILVSLAGIYHIIYAKRIIPGVKIGSVRVGGKTYDQAKKALESREAELSKDITFNYNDTKFTITDDEIGLRYEWDAAVTRAYEIGRTGNILVDTKDKFAGIFKELFIAAFYDYEEELLSDKMGTIRSEVNKDGGDSGYEIDGEKLVVNSSKTGIRVADDALFLAVVYSYDRLDFAPKDLPVKVVKPDLLESDLMKVLPQAEKIVFNEITIKRGTKKWVLDSPQLLNLLALKKKGNELTLTLNEPKFEAFLETLAQEVNEMPRGKVAKLDGDKVVEFEILTGGAELDDRAFTEVFKEAFFSGKKEIDLSMKDISGPTDINKYGIRALLGEGQSRFTGSAKARVKNLTLAAERTNGVLVPPGGIYSMNNSIGEISAKTGYDTAYIIQNGRTVLGEGGGVCQTSTTLFRAVLNAGLPIEMRYPHAYRVYYYEIDSKPGFDASIYQPSLDFQFRNDTPNYVLVQSEADPASATLKFKIYGTPDGRQVEITEPVITNQAPPPEAQYVDDPSLPKGTTKQVDFAAWGAHASFTRTVRKNGEILHNETFSSRYQPWRAVYLVGTKE